MKNQFTQLLMFSLIVFSGVATGAEHKELKAFPAAQQGMERVVIILPHKERAEEGDFKVELIPGKSMQTDGVNRVRLGAKIEPRPLKGWGYTYYELIGSDQVMSTRIGVPDGENHVDKFVQGSSLLIRYNSRLPIVVYIPEGFKVRYRIWKAGESVVAEAG